ncbi:MAG TPA: hypothetical protein PLX17_00540 [Chitinophagaceae bacterium]|nr:hypothetical protein [Chitinophagaceae bacterium]
MKYVLVIIFLASCTVYKKPQKFDFGKGLVLCHCPSDSVYKLTSPAVVGKVNPDSCKHYYTMVTLMACNPPSNQCNIATCMDCGYSWKSY